MRQEIRLSDCKDIHRDAIISLYESNHWSSARKPKQLVSAIHHSHSVVTAWLSDELIAYGKKTQPTCFASILRGRSKAGMPRTEPRSTLQALPSQHNRNPNPTNRRSPT